MVTVEILKIVDKSKAYCTTLGQFSLIFCVFGFSRFFALLTMVEKTKNVKKLIKKPQNLCKMFVVCDRPKIGKSKN